MRRIPEEVPSWIPEPANGPVLTGGYPLETAKNPEGSVVLSIDEKTGMQAISRKHLDRPPRPGVLRRQEFEYVRHGTQALIAAPCRSGLVQDRNSGCA